MFARICSKRAFIDRRADCFNFTTASFSGYPWKPKIALILPFEFALNRRSHLCDLAVALEVLASATEHYNLEVVSNSPSASRLFPSVTPYSREALTAFSGAFVLLSRTLNEEVSANCPSRYIAADPCAFRTNKHRIVFETSGVMGSGSPVDDSEILRGAHGTVAAFIDENDDASAYLNAMRRLRSRGLSLRITLSSRSDEHFARWVHDAFENDPRAEVRDAEPSGFEDRTEFRVSNEPIALLTQRRSNLPRFLFRCGEFRRPAFEHSERSDLYLFRGEETNAHSLVDRWLGPRKRDRPGRAPKRIASAIEPLVSIIVPNLRPYGRDPEDGSLDLFAGVSVDRDRLRLQRKSPGDDRGDEGRGEVLDETPVLGPDHRTSRGVWIGDYSARSGYPGQ